MDAKAFYDRYWKGDHIKDKPFHDPLVEWTQENFDYHMRFFHAYTDGNLLDFGCGDGQFLHLASKYCAKAYGVDVSEHAIEKARDRFPELEFEIFQTEKGIPYANNYFDTVSAIEVLEHILDIEAVLEELNRVLKPGGHLLITTTELTRLKTVLIAARYLDDYFYPTSPHIRFFTRKNLADILCRKGFSVVEYKKNRTYFGFIPQGQMVVARKEKNVKEDSCESIAGTAI